MTLNHHVSNCEDPVRLSSLIALSSLALLPAGAQAQVVSRYVGLTGGATTSSLASGGISSDWRWGGTAGLMLGTVTFDYSFVELAPSWAQMGGGDVRLDYIDVPLLIGGYMPLGGRETIARLYAGVGIGFKVGCNDTAGGVSCTGANGSAWSLPIGLSFARQVSSGKFIGIDGRYLAPLSDAATLGTRNRSWQFRLMFGSSLGR